MAESYISQRPIFYYHASVNSIGLYFCILLPRGSERVWGQPALIFEMRESQNRTEEIYGGMRLETQSIST